MFTKSLRVILAALLMTLVLHSLPTSLFAQEVKVIFDDFNDNILDPMWIFPAGNPNGGGILVEEKEGKLVFSGVTTAGGTQIAIWQEAFDLSQNFSVEAAVELTPSPAGVVSQATLAINPETPGAQGMLYLLDVAEGKFSLNCKTAMEGGEWIVLDENLGTGTGKLRMSYDGAKFDFYWWDGAGWVNKGSYEVALTGNGFAGLVVGTRTTEETTVLAKFDDFKLTVVTIEIPEITEVHFLNNSRPGATDIALGEEFKVTAVATPGLTNLQGAIANGDISPPDESCVIGDFFTLTEVSVGNYEYTGILTTNIDKAGREASRIIAVAGIFEVGIVRIAPEVLTVTIVLPPAEALKIEIQEVEDLKEEISISGIVIARGLNAKLDAIVDSINRAIIDIAEGRYSQAANTINEAQNQLGAFVNMVSAQSGKKVSQELAQKWLAEAQGITAELEEIKAQLGVSSPASKKKVSAQADLNADGKVSEADLEVLKKAFNSKPGDANWNPECDLNGDGKIDLGDFGVLVKEYNK